MIKIRRPRQRYLVTGFETNYLVTDNLQTTTKRMKTTQRDTLSALAWRRWHHPKSDSVSVQLLLQIRSITPSAWLCPPHHIQIFKQATYALQLTSNWPWHATGALPADMIKQPALGNGREGKGTRHRQPRQITWLGAGTGPACRLLMQPRHVITHH